jgi:hypothetical protein
MKDASSKPLIEKGVITNPDFKQKLLQCADYRGIFSPTTQ